MKALPIIILCLVILISCHSGTQKQAPLSEKSLPATKTTDTTLDLNGGIPIFYNMYLSVEMSTLFKSMGVTFDGKILNSPGRISRYTSSMDKALNLGVYAVDLSYAKYFEQTELAGKYLQSMHELSSGLGIPDQEFNISVKRIENNLANKDSLIRIANELYKATENHLKQTDRGSAAAFIIAGGWTEALYIATDLIPKTQEKDIELLQRIEEQKYSLSDLIELLKKHDNELAVKEMLSKLSDLKSSFDKFKIVQNKADEKSLKEIALKINSLRTDLIN